MDTPRPTIDHRMASRVRLGGMTLIELIVVIAIIAVLVAIIFPAIANARQAANKVAAIGQERQLGLAAELYANDSDGYSAPSTNYSLDPTDPDRIWPGLLFGYAGDSKAAFIAKGSKGQYPGTWHLRGWGSFGMNSATAVDPDLGCQESDDDKTNCSAFTTATVIDKAANPAFVPLFTTTPEGPTEKNYRGYEFNAYNGLPRTDNVDESPPLISDRDLVPELPVLPGDFIKAVFARYNSTGLDEGFAPVVFADGHAKAYTAKQIKTGKTGILWRFR